MGMATHSSILAPRIPWTEEPGKLQSMESQRLGHDWSDLSQASELISWNVFYFPQNFFCFPLHLSLPLLFQNTKVFYNISDQWLHHIVHILSVGPPIFAESPSSPPPPFHLFSPFCPLDFLDLLPATPHILTLLPTSWLKLCSENSYHVFLSLTLMVSVITYFSSPTLQPFPYPCFWKLMKASSPSVGAYYQLPTLLH